MRISDWSSDVCSSDLKESGAKDRFAIGVAVADSPLGPWRDAHPAGPIISQRVPQANEIQNIDPTVLVDDDRSEEHTSELQSLMRNSYAVFCLKKKKNK